jgi:hypothetical protein
MGAGSFFILRSENVSLVFSEFVCVLIIQSFLSSTVIIISLESSPHQITHQVIIIPLELSSHQITHQVIIIPSSGSAKKTFLVLPCVSMLVTSLN